MDDRRFDDLVRGLATGSSSRRGVLRAAMGAAAAAVFGARDASAARCRNVGEVCTKDGNCCSAICGAKDKSGRRRCACPAGTTPCKDDCVDPATAYQSDPKNCGACGQKCPSTQCAAGICTNGVCGYAAIPAKIGKACDDRDRCTLNDVCQADGSCRGTPVVCTALDACHTAGTCDPKTGTCSNPAKLDGDSCGGGLHCCAGICCPNAIDVCHNGSCCTPNAKTTTCAGKCGTVTDNCGQAIDCGGCELGRCLTCNADHVCVSTCGAGQSCCGRICRQNTDSTCTQDSDCCSSVCVGGVCQAGCIGEGGRCDSSTDCCDGRNCVNITNGVGVCCTPGTLACGGTCCLADTVCRSASCSGTVCSYTTKSNCCEHDGECPTPIDPCLRAVCNLANNTCGTAPANDGTACGTGRQCCGGDCIDVSSDADNCGSCGHTCAANTACDACPPLQICDSHTGCCKTGTCSAGQCNGLTNTCPSCSTPACDPTRGPICVDNCPPPSDACHTDGVCQFNGTCTYAAKCGACETCDPSTGACLPKTCGTCETCDQASDTCVPCGICETCDTNTGTCVGKSCGDCELCDPDTGQCVSWCNSCQRCIARGCVANPRNAGESCGTCQECDLNGNCLPTPEGSPCGTCGICSAAGNCQIAPVGTSCGTCKVCSIGGDCVPAPAGTRDSDCSANQACDGNGNCTCAVPCSGVCCSAGNVACCDSLAGFVCCPRPCGFNTFGGSFCPPN